MCDASAAVPVRTNLFLAASDEDNALRLYSFDTPGPALREFELSRFIGVVGKSIEADIEGAALIGNRAFWIGSRGRNYLGKVRLNRCGLFATDILNPGPKMSLLPVGLPYRTLLEDLERDPRMARFHLEHASILPPKHEGALNIEGLAATSAGWFAHWFSEIPFRTRKRWLFPCSIQMRWLPAADHGLAIRFCSTWAGWVFVNLCFHSGSYTIIAGPADIRRAAATSGFFEWSGESGYLPAKAANHIRGYSPEAVMVREGIDGTDYFS